MICEYECATVLEPEGSSQSQSRLVMVYSRLLIIMFGLHSWSDTNNEAEIYRTAANADEVLAWSILREFPGLGAVR